MLDIIQVPAVQGCEMGCGGGFFDANIAKILPVDLYRDSVTRYAVAFLRWKIYNQSAWSYYFRNQAQLNDGMGVRSASAFSESSFQSIGGDAYATGFDTPIPGAIDKIDLSSTLYIPEGLVEGYRLKWQGGNIHRILFTSEIKPSASGALAIDFSVVTMENLQASPLNLGDHDVVVTLLANCEDALGCGKSVSTKTITMFPFLNNITLQCQHNGLYTLYIPLSEFGVDETFCQALQVVGIDFLADSGDVAVLTPRFG